MNNHNVYDTIKKKYEYNFDNFETENNIGTFIKLYKCLYFKNYLTFCTSLIPLKYEVLNDNIEKEKKKIHEYLNDIELSENKKKIFLERMNKIIKIQEEVNEISCQFKDMEKKNKNDYTFNITALINIANDYLKIKNVKDAYLIFKSLSEEIIINSVKLFIKNEKMLIILYDKINNIKI